MQALTVQLGGKVEASSKKREYGFAKVSLQSSCTLFDTLQDSTDEDGKPTLDVWMSHSDKIQQIPEFFTTIGSTDTCTHAAMCSEERRIYGIQFHPEVTHTKQGVNILKNFVLKICKCETVWKCENIIDDIVQKIRSKVQDDRVILALSGGVDSSTTALLLQKAIGENLLCIFVDNGLLRLNEAEQVMHMFKDEFGLHVIKVDAQDRFFTALSGVSDPEKKRKIIGNIFIDIFTEKAKEFEDIKWLSQGTIYPDVIESASSTTNKAEVIKSHHNVAGLPQKMSLQLVEPLRELFKDEVRKIGLALGLPSSMIYRHPFPGPGLGVRILGELKKEYCDILRLADAIFIEELRRDNLYDKVSQAFAVFLPIRSVSVMGDQRKYSWVIALRAVETIDFMTATWSELPHAFLAKVSNRIMNEVHDISRVVYDISGKPPSTIEWE
uniref:GMP synthase [glutamine-hydrolyzing] n=1 Tax=Lygus hesperus TaxID=30085 RepID=A0A0A9XZZ7_LYGHE